MIKAFIEKSRRPVSAEERRRLVFVLDVLASVYAGVGIMGVVVGISTLRDVEPEPWARIALGSALLGIVALYLLFRRWVQGRAES